MASRKAWSLSPIQWTARHVAGHQHEDPNHELDIWERLNVEADALVKQFLPVAAMKPRHYSIGWEPWSLWHKGKK
jgi:hypothetical protein